MTIGLALQGDGFAVLAADSQATRGNVKFLEDKIRPFGPSLWAMWTGFADNLGYGSHQIMDLPERTVTVSSEQEGVAKVYEVIRLVHDKHVGSDTPEEKRHPHALILATRHTPTIYRATEKGIERAEPGQVLWVSGWEMLPAETDSQAAGERLVTSVLYHFIEKEENRQLFDFPITCVSAGPDGVTYRRWESWHFDPNCWVLDPTTEEEEAT